MGAPRKKSAPRRKKEKNKYESIQFAASGGSRDLYRTAAELEHLTLNEWMRTALFERAERVLKQHKINYEMPLMHPERPRPLPIKRR